MKKGNGMKYVIVSIVWISVVVTGFFGYKFFLKPRLNDDLMEATGSSSSYKEEATINLDGFSGYAILRSPIMMDELKSEGIRLVVEDDEADTEKRIKALRDGKADFAVFTIDSFKRACVDLGESPATAIIVIDISEGADAVVAYDTSVKTIDDLNDPKAKFILTPYSPSEHLGRVVKASFRLPNMPKNWIIEADGSSDAYKQFKTLDKSKKIAAIMWEPDVSRALELSNAHVLIDSSRLKGQIVDILVVSRRFLQEKPEIVQKVAEAYLRAVYHYNNDEDALLELIQDDAKDFGQKLKDDQAKKLIEGIRWANTIENYAHFALVRGSVAKGLPTMEDMIVDISSVLMKTGAFSDDPFAGQESSLFYDEVLKELRDNQFHPGKSLDIIDGGMVDSPEMERVRGVADLRTLSDSQWGSLTPVGQMDVQKISFGRGKSNILTQGQRELETLAKTLESFPHYYLKIVGNARSDGDLQANIDLASNRAQAVYDHLRKKGVDKKRMNAVGAQPSSQGGQSQSVKFVVGQLPY